MNAVEIENVTKTFGKVTAVDHLSLRTDFPVRKTCRDFPDGKDVDRETVLRLIEHSNRIRHLGPILSAPPVSRKTP